MVLLPVYAAARGRFLCLNGTNGDGCKRIVRFRRKVFRGLGIAMLTITIQVNAPAGQAIGVKEDLAQYLERFGDAWVVSVVEKLPEQLRMDEGGSYGKRNLPRMRR